jgi:hypothetical protein
VVQPSADPGPEPAPVAHRPEPEDLPCSYQFCTPEDTPPFELRCAQADTIADAKRRIADYLNSRPESTFDADPDNIELLFRGKAMKDHLVLSRQRIPPDGVIMLYVPDLREILVRSQVGCKMPKEELNVTFLRRRWEPLKLTIESRSVIRQVKEQLVGSFGVRVDGFDLVHRDANGIPEVLDDRSYVSETAIAGGSKVIIIDRGDDQPPPLPPGQFDPWEQEVLGLVPVTELKRLHAGTSHANDIDLIIADIVHRGDMHGLSGM